jgi:ribosome maturation factor RimP
MRKLVYRFYNLNTAEVLETSSYELAQKIRTDEEYEDWQGSNIKIKTELVECSDHLVNDGDKKFHLPTPMEMANA